MPIQETVQRGEVLNRVNKRQKGIQMLKFGQMDVFRKSLPGFVFGTRRLRLNQWNHKVYSMNMLNSRLICTRDFSSFKSKPRNILSRHKTYGWIHEESGKYVSNYFSFRKTCRERCSQSLERPEGLKPSPLSSKYKKLSESQRIEKTSSYRGPCYPICLRGVHWRGFHSSLFSLAKSDSNKPPSCTKMDEICKSTEEKKTDECGQVCDEKSDVCRQEKVKCDKVQQSRQKVKQKPKEEKIVDPAECRKTCLPIGKCEWPHTVSPPKMEYVKVTCPPPKFVKPNLCPPILEYFQNNEPVIETKQVNTRKKKVCPPIPLPKPPYAPVVLCPCPPPSKIHPGPCPCYKMKVTVKRPIVQSCPPKKKYPCPTGVYYCLPQKKPCKLKKQEDICHHKKKKEAPAA